MSNPENAKCVRDMSVPPELKQERDEVCLVNILL